MLSVILSIFLRLDSVPGFNKYKYLKLNITCDVSRFFLTPSSLYYFLIQKLDFQIIAYIRWVLHRNKRILNCYSDALDKGPCITNQLVVYNNYCLLEMDDYTDTQPTASTQYDLPEYCKLRVSKPHHS